MRISTAINAASLLFAASARATFGGPSENNQAVLDNNPLSVPGDNPLSFCKSPKDWVLTVDSVDLDPNPPRAGTTLNVTASGVFTDDVQDGAQIFLTVRYGVITILRQQHDLCETVKQVDLECPLEKGPMTLTKSVDLPKEIPPGKYSVVADVISKDEERITCLTATVHFERGGSFKFW